MNRDTKYQRNEETIRRRCLKEFLTDATYSGEFLCSFLVLIINPRDPVYM